MPVDQFDLMLTALDMPDEAPTLTKLVQRETASGRLIVVDAIDDTATAFYRYHDFQPVRDNPRRLVITISTVRKALGD